MRRGNGLARELQAFQEADQLRVLGISSEKGRNGQSQGKQEQQQERKAVLAQFQTLCLDEENNEEREEDRDGDTDSLASMNSLQTHDTDSTLEAATGSIEKKSQDEEHVGRRGVVDTARCFEEKSRLKHEGQPNGEEQGVEAVNAEDVPEEPLDHLSALPNELFELVMLFVGENWFHFCREVLPNWSDRLSSEYLWQNICLRTYLPPAYAMVSCVNGKPRKYRSWKRTALKRPRVKCSGIYIHRHTFIRDRGPRNMWSAGFDTRFLEISHYRYAMFLQDGNLLYSSTPVEPKRMIPILRNLFLQVTDKRKEGGEDQSSDLIAMLPLRRVDELPATIGLREDRVVGGNPLNEEVERSKRVYFGKYQVIGNEMTFVANLGEYSVKFGFEIDDVETITTVFHESLIHPKQTKHVLNDSSSKHRTRRERKLLQSRMDEGSDTNEDMKPIRHPLAEQYRFERQWRFNPLF